MILYRNNSLQRRSGPSSRLEDGRGLDKEALHLRVPKPTSLPQEGVQVGQRRLLQEGPKRILDKLSKKRAAKTAVHQDLHLGLGGNDSEGRS